MEPLLTCFSRFSSGDYGACVDALNALIVTQPSVTLLLNRSLAYFRLDLFRKALADADSALGVDPLNASAFLLKGIFQHRLGKKKLAVKSWQEGLKVAKEFTVHLQLTHCTSGHVEHVIDALFLHSRPTPAPAVSHKAETKAPEPKPPIEVSTQSTDSGSHFQFRANLDRRESAPDIDLSQFDAIAAAAHDQIQHRVGDLKIDKIIAFGYLKVNSGKLEDAIEIFNSLLRNYPSTLAAYLGRGTAFALAGQLEKATMDFTKALEIDPKCHDALKRRGQTRAALGHDRGALEDFTAAIAINPDHEAHQQRGIVYYKLKNYRRASKDFEVATKFNHADATTWNHLGLCYDQLGASHEAVESHIKAIALKKDFKESYVNLGQAYRNWGQFDEARTAIEKALAIDPNYAHAFHIRGLLFFGVGEHHLAKPDFLKAVQLDATIPDVHIMLAVVQHGLGEIRSAVADYNRVLSLAPQNPCFYQRELALWWHHHLDESVYEHNLDRELDAEFKEFFSKRQPPALLRTYKEQPRLAQAISDIQYRGKPADPAMAQLVKFSFPFGRHLHQDSPGYLSNRRQQQMAGLAALEIAQTLREVWFGGKTTVSGARSSAGKAGVEHEFGWRDVYDIAIRWRQFSEPNDPVWWVDLLTPEQFAEGFGSHTPMITGQCNVVRYSPNVTFSWPIFIDEITKQRPLTDAQKKNILAAKTCEDVYKVMGADFFITTPCLSLRTGKMMEGTRLTLQKTEPEGFEYSIRTPGTPPRWIDYDLELKHHWQRLTSVVKEAPDDIETITELILTIAFYWYNFMPLSRGTAACGMFHAVGYRLNKFVPHKFLVDWEAILRPHPTHFIDRLRPWMFPARERINMEDFDRLPKVKEVFSTLRRVIQGLNVDINLI